MGTNKSIGTAFETALVKYFQKCGFESCRRVVLHGANDEADIHIGKPNDPYFTIEAKSRKIEAPYKMVEDFMEEAHREYLNAKPGAVLDHSRALLAIKRPNLGVQDSWLCWKTYCGITIRCRLQDIVNENLLRFSTEEERMKCLNMKINNTYYK